MLYSPSHSFCNQPNESDSLTPPKPRPITEPSKTSGQIIIVMLTKPVGLMKSFFLFYLVLPPTLGGPYTLSFELDQLYWSIENKFKGHHSPNTGNRWVLRCIWKVFFQTNNSLVSLVKYVVHLGPFYFIFTAFLRETSTEEQTIQGDRKSVV